jgi:hypothetical protein
MYLLVFHAYINEMHVQEAKSPVKNLVRQRCAEGFNSGVKRSTGELLASRLVIGVGDPVSVR